MSIVNCEHRLLFKDVEELDACIVGCHCKLLVILKGERVDLPCVLLIGFQHKLILELHKLKAACLLSTE